MRSRYTFLRVTNFPTIRLQDVCVPITIIPKKKEQQKIILLEKEKSLTEDGSTF